jgi:hypothetical protein
MASWVPAAIGAGAQLVGGKMGSRSADKAQQAQTQANREALGFQRGVYNQALEDYNRRNQQWEAGRAALLQRYGIDVPRGATVGSLLGNAGELQPAQPIVDTQTLKARPQGQVATARRTIGSLIGGA